MKPIELYDLPLRKRMHQLAERTAILANSNATNPYVKIGVLEFRNSCDGAKLTINDEAFYPEQYELKEKYVLFKSGTDEYKVTAAPKEIFHILCQ